jgi:hypothetical protein
LFLIGRLLKIFSSETAWPNESKIFHNIEHFAKNKQTKTVNFEKKIKQLNFLKLALLCPLYLRNPINKKQK